MKAPQILQHFKNVQHFVGYATLTAPLKSLQHLQSPKRLFLIKQHCNIRDTLKA